jgi:quercetin dioxygenase-like cupin family protein
MFATNLNDLELDEQQTDTDPTLGCRVAFPLYAATGAAASAVVYFEVPPGGRLGRHTDSAEEVLLVLAGEAEAEIGDERGLFRPGGLALVPAMVPHDIRNVGNEPVRIVGFFGNAAVVHRFFEYLPGDEEAIFFHGPNGFESLTAVPAGVPASA